jgi:hypothetical protein
MKKESTQFWFIVSATVLLLGMLAAAGIALDSPKKKIIITGVAKKCLACHSYDKIRQSTAKYKMPSGERVTPHQYLPHDDMENGKIPDCTDCHVAHPVPLVDKSTVVKPKNITFCYTACHHMKNLAACSICHRKGASRESKSNGRYGRRER